MIRPLVPLTLKGAIWYQGESNTYNPALYRRIFPAMIRSWRELFNQGDFPFYYVQIAPYPYGGDMTRGAKIREVQRETLSKVAKVGMAVLMDRTSLTCIHPPYKKEAGERLALWALKKDYGKDIVFSGPLYKEMKVEGSKVRVSFHQVKKGLTSNGTPLEGFEIAGEDKVFHPAEAVIEGKTVVVSSGKVKKPVAVQYGFKDTSTATLFNEAGLPASSFTTIDW
jgi:sialate O-acetylesterase